MTLSEALLVVISLAEGNGIEEPGAEDEQVVIDEYKRQQQALDIVARLYAEEVKEEEKHPSCVVS